MDESRWHVPGTGPSAQHDVGLALFSRFLPLVSRASSSPAMERGAESKVASVEQLLGGAISPPSDGTGGSARPGGLVFVEVRANLKFGEAELEMREAAALN